MIFEKVIKQVKILTPPEFMPKTQAIEYRRDPLTGSRCIINTKRAQRARQAEQTARVPESISEETEEGCFFCPEQINDATPKFLPEIAPKGRIERGQCTIFPNLFAFGEHHAVATFSNAHFLNINQFTPKMIMANMLVCQEWMLSVKAQFTQAKYPVYVWNHLPPSGASMVHPHVQILMRDDPTGMQHRLLRKSEEYFAANGRNYWEELVEEEKSIGERYIWESDSLAVLASYAPQGFREIQIILKRTCTFTDLNINQIEDFAQTIVTILDGYKKMGVGSFNMITFSGPTDEKLEHYTLNAKIISRPFPQGLYTNVTGAFERLQDEWVIETLPEDTANIMRKSFLSND